MSALLNMGKEGKKVVEMTIILEIWKSERKHKGQCECTRLCLGFSNLTGGFKIRIPGEERAPAPTLQARPPVVRISY